ncbi:MAG TPA: winged helix DNA-binding domain-containing protein [Aggregatilineales bacterium]|nr:winged helix DNA-binding domain-containing protein [Aggregatilineales bacterium]
MADLSPDQVRARRLHGQCLDTRRPAEALVDAVRAVCGVQAQLLSAMLLALRARVRGLTAADVDEAIRDSRRLVRTWVMRGTLHLIPSEDVRWLVSLFGPLFIPKGKRRRLQLGLSEDLSTRGLKAIREILRQDTPLTRGEIVERLNAQGVVLERRSQAPIHLIGLAALEGIVCLGPDRPNGESTYVLLDRWIEESASAPHDSGLADLSRRYLAGYGPADVRDFAAWSGLTVTEARRGWEQVRDQDGLIEVHSGDRVLWLPASAASMGNQASPSVPIVRLLPAFDAYVLGYANRDEVVRPEYQGEVYHGGQTVPVVLVNGETAGVWRYERQGKLLRITVHPFEAFDSPVQRRIAEEAEDIGRFWNTRVSLSYTRERL